MKSGEPDFCERRSAPAPEELDMEEEGEASEDAVRGSANKSAASAASPDYVKFQAVIKSAASAASLAEAALAADWITAPFLQFLAAPAAKKYQKIVKISGSDNS